MTSENRLKIHGIFSILNLIKSYLIKSVKRSIIKQSLWGEKLKFKFSLFNPLKTWLSVQLTEQICVYISFEKYLYPKQFKNSNRNVTKLCPKEIMLQSLVLKRLCYKAFFLKEIMLQRLFQKRLCYKDFSKRDYGLFLKRLCYKAFSKRDYITKTFPKEIILCFKNVS